MLPGYYANIAHDCSRCGNTNSSCTGGNAYTTNNFRPPVSRSTS